MNFFKGPVGCYDPSTMAETLAALLRTIMEDRFDGKKDRLAKAIGAFEGALPDVKRNTLDRVVVSAPLL